MLTQCTHNRDGHGLMMGGEDCQIHDDARGYQGDDDDDDGGGVSQFLEPIGIQ